MLDTEILDGGAAEGQPVLILMHGRGADTSDLAPLRRWLPDEITVVLARAPFEAARWGYGPGRAWYLYEGDDRPEAESFRRSQQELEALVAGLGQVLGADPGPVLLGGFSQGGTMSLGYALRRPGEIAGALNFSGFVPDHPDVPGSPRGGDPGLPDGAEGFPVFWGHGTMDPAIPFDMARNGRERLRDAGFQVEARDYQMGHGISPDELRDASRWLEGRLARSSRR